MRRKSVWVILAVLAVSLTALFVIRMVSGRRDAEKSPEKADVQEDYPAQEGREVDGAAQKAPGQEEGNRDPSGGGSGPLTYVVRQLWQEYQADDGAPIFSVQLSWPAFDGEGEGVKTINRYFENWAQAKLAEYGGGQNSTRQSALEVYRESRSTSWTGPWGETYAVESVQTHGDYVSILMASSLAEGAAGGLPYRESHLFRISDGERVGICEITKKEQKEWDRILRENFSRAVREGDPALYYNNALERLQTCDMQKAGCYFSDTGIVFYLPPYEIAPYSTGYVEVLIPYDEAGA